MNNTIVANILNLFSKLPDRKEYYKKFEGNVPRNTKIPDGVFAVTVNYNSETTKMKVTQIHHNGKPIAVREGYDITLDYNILEEYFQSIYNTILSVEDRQEYTNKNINELEKLKGSYKDSLVQIGKKVEELNESIRKPDSSLASIIQRLFGGGKKINLNDDINNFTKDVNSLLSQVGTAHQTALLENFKKYYDEKINVLIETVTSILAVKGKITYTATLMNDLICILENVVGTLNDYKLGTISLDALEHFKKEQKK